MKYVTTEEEQMLLRDLHPLPRIIYHDSLKRRYDLNTGLVGGLHGISYQAIAEDIYGAPQPGIAAYRPSRWALDRAVHHLIQRGLVYKKPDLRSNRDQRLLIFSLPKAPRPLLVSEKPARKPHQNPHRPAHRGDPQKPAHGYPPKAALHPESTFATVAANTGGDIATSGAAEKLTWQTTFPQGYSQEEQRQILQVSDKNHLDADAVRLLLDELTGAEKKAKAPIRVRAAFFSTLVRQWKAQTFFGNQARQERASGTPLSESELSYSNEGNPHHE